MKTAFLMHGIGWGGAAGSLLLLLQSLKNVKVEKHLITTIDRDNLARKEFIKYSDSFKVIDLPQLRNQASDGRTSLKQFNKIINGDYSALIDYLKELEIDILHINSTVFSYLLESLKNELNIKIITHIRETLPAYDNGIIRNYIIEKIEKYSDKIICISDNEAAYFKDSNKIVILPNPFDFDYKYDIKQFYREKNHIESGTLLVAMSGQFSRSKGHLFFLKVINEILSYNEVKNKIKFIVFGLNEYTPLWKVIMKKILGRKDLSYEYKTFIHKHKLESYVDSLPFLYTNEFFNILNEVDIYVRPSLAGDPWGRDVIEAMAFGKPIVATGSSKFFIEDGVNGFLVEPQDCTSLAEKILDLVQNENLRKEIGRRNKEKIKEMCDLEKYGIEIEKILNELLKTVAITKCK